VLFPFGHGLSYTLFQVYGASVLGTIATGGDGDHGSVRVTASVTNTGDRAGAETIQVNVAPPAGKVDRQPKTLVGLEKEQVRQGETKQASLEFGREAAVFWDEELVMTGGSGRSRRGRKGSSLRPARILTTSRRSWCFT
jgi:beta-glucosidase